MFILASASPRRRDLLLQIGADFAAVTSGAEESLEEAQCARKGVRGRG